MSNCVSLYGRNKQTILFVCFNILILNFPGSPCLKKGIELRGGDIKNITFTTAGKCREECEKMSDCVAFSTYAGEENKCVLKNQTHGEETTNGLAMSARMSCYEG